MKTNLSKYVVCAMFIVAAVMFFMPQAQVNAQKEINIEKAFKHLTDFGGAPPEVAEQDFDEDGYLSEKELKKVKKIKEWGVSKKTLDFKNLHLLKNLRYIEIGAKNIKHLKELTKLPKLDTIILTSNKNHSLDLRKNNKLCKLTLKMPQATKILISPKNKIKYMNINIKKNAWKCARQCKKLKVLKLDGLDETLINTGTIQEAYFYGVKKENITINNSATLKSIYVSGAGSVDIKNKKTLKRLDLRSCTFSKLDVSGYPQLEKLSLQLCPDLTQLSLRKLPKIKIFTACKNGKVEEVSLEDVPSLKEFFWDLGSLKRFSVAEGNNLENIHVFNNQIESIDFSKLKKLKQLDMSTNHCGGEIDFSQMPALKWADCGNNQLKKIVAQNHKTLEILMCSNNQLKTIDLSGSMKLNCLDCYSNPFVEIYQSKNFEGCNYDDNAVIHRL